MKEVKIRLYNNNVINCIVNNAIIGLQSNEQLIYETKRLVEDDCGDFLFTKDLINISEKLKDINDFNKKVVILNIMTESLLYKKLDLNIENRFVDNRNGTITDNATELIWQKKVPKKNITWLEAIEYASKLTLVNTEWRLPDINELKSLVDKTKFEPATRFPSMMFNWFWSSSSYATYSLCTWYVYFRYGDVFSVYKDYNIYVRCVCF